jgi:cullin-4
MVQRLLDFKSFAESTLPTAFADEVETPSVGTSEQGAMPQKQPNKDFGYALIDAFQTGFKARRNKPAEMIAKYLDKAMRKGQKDTSDAAFEALLDSALGLYRFTNDKDVFRTFYHRALAKRLLLERSASNDFEKAMLKKLKERMLTMLCRLLELKTDNSAEYDPDFGMGDHMFNDLALSRETMLEFLSKEDADHPSQNLTVMVLQQSVWPFPVRKKDAGLPLSVGHSITLRTVRS